MARTKTTSSDERAEAPYVSLWRLAKGALAPPPGRGRIALALAYGLIVHLLFTVAVVAMIWAMFFGMSRSFGIVPSPYSWVVNGLLLAQFPLVHSALLNGWGGRLLRFLAPDRHAGTLSTTLYAIVASAQLALLFLLWTPSGVIWWQAEGWAFYGIAAAYCTAWLLLIKASYDAGAEVQAGALGWMSLLQNIKPKFPDMPVTGLFRLIRQPIYVSFALTLWTVPIWTPDQLLVAVVLTTYCLLAPRLKERRFQARYGQRFEQYKAHVPYAMPCPWRRTEND